MPKVCAAPNCKNSSASRKGWTFHRFPLSRPDIVKQWLHAMGRENWTPRSDHVICSAHFDAGSFLTLRGGSKRLKPDTIPVKFDPTPVQPINKVKISPAPTLLVQIRPAPPKQLSTPEYDTDSWLEDPPTPPLIKRSQVLTAAFHTYATPATPEAHKLQLEREIQDLQRQLASSKHAQRKLLKKVQSMQEIIDYMLEHHHHPDCVDTNESKCYKDVSVEVEENAYPLDVHIQEAGMDALS